MSSKTSKVGEASDASEASNPIEASETSKASETRNASKASNATKASETRKTGGSSLTGPTIQPGDSRKAGETSKVGKTGKSGISFTADAFDPYANEADVVEIGNLCIENRVDRISLHGDVDLTRDQSGLAKAKLLQRLLNDAVAVLEAQSLPEVLPPPAVKTVKNPFA